MNERNFFLDFFLLFFATDCCFFVYRCHPYRCIDTMYTHIEQLSNGIDTYILVSSFVLVSVKIVCFSVHLFSLMNFHEKLSCRENGLQRMKLLYKMIRCYTTIYPLDIGSKQQHQPTMYSVLVLVLPFHFVGH